MKNKSDAPGCLVDCLVRGFWRQVKNPTRINKGSAGSKAQKISNLKNPKCYNTHDMKNTDIIKRIEEITAKADAEGRDLTESEAEESERLTDQAYNQI